ncbi:MAG: outer membrane lipoprotein carrier protein LolA [Clostridiales bacterium]|nr:outer membrane lipoprotein carrier protein LolA [Clostridiales bacterium]
MRLYKQLLLIFVVISVGISTACAKRQRSEKEVVDHIKNMQSYQCKTKILVHNDRQDLEYQCNLYYDRNNGNRLELGKDRIYIFKDNITEVQDNVNKRRYTVESQFEDLYYFTFVNEYIKLIYVNEDTKYYIEEKDGKRYQLIELTIPANNRNINKAVLHVDAESLVPAKILIYDSNNRKRVDIAYSDFKANIKLDKKLFSFQ